jgi:hypothetical protein
MELSKKLERWCTIYAKLLLVLFVALAVQSCKRPNYDLPYSYPENAPEVWKLAWQHGCRSGFSVYGNLWYKTWYHFEQDVSRIDDPIYYKGWMDSFNYCRAYINRSLAGDSVGAAQDSIALFSNSRIGTITGNKRDSKAVNGSDRLFGNLFRGVDAPGWNEEWKGYNGEESCDWLGRCGSAKRGDYEL